MLQNMKAISITDQFLFVVIKQELRAQVDIFNIDEIVIVQHWQRNILHFERNGFVVSLPQKKANIRALLV